MEQKFEKNIIERFGDFYSKLGRRFLFNLGCIVFFVLLELVLAGTGIGAFAAILWVYNLLSICEKEKTRYIKSVQITLPNGEKTGCALFEQSVYAYAPMILAFFSIGFYIPYKKQYILVRNMEVKNYAQGTRVSPSFLAQGLLNMEILPKSKYSAIIANPQIISNEIYAQFAPRREAFLRETKPFVETGLIEEIYYTDRLSICKLYDDESYILFHYESHSNIQCGLLFNKDFIEKIKEDDSFLLESYIQMDNPNIVFLTNELLERLLRNRKNTQGDNHEKLENGKLASDDETPSETEQNAEANYISEVNKNKKVFTSEMIASRLKSGKCTWRLVWGIILLYFSIGGFCLTVGGIGSGMIVLTIIGLPLWALLTYFGVKNIKISKKNRSALTTGQYKIVKATCIKRVDEQQTDADGDPCGYQYIHHFSNGDVLKLGYVFAVKGDTVYLVYLNDNKKISTFFNAIEYVPADNLVIEE